MLAARLSAIGPMPQTAPDSKIFAYYWFFPSKESRFNRKNKKPGSKWRRGQTNVKRSQISSASAIFRYKIRRRGKTGSLETALPMYIRAGVLPIQGFSVREGSCDLARDYHFINPTIGSWFISH
jgi:hypothetical protein